MGFIESVVDFLGKKVDNAEIMPVSQKAIEQLALKEIALHIGISYIANALSKCEFKTYENNEEVKGKLYYMLNISPNPNENSSQFVNKIIENYFWKGHALVVPKRNNIYCADDFAVDKTRPIKGYLFTSIAYGSENETRSFKSKEVFYFKLDNKDVKAMIDSLYMQYGELMSQAVRSYKKSNGEKYKLALDSYQAGDPKFKKIYEEVLQKQLKNFLECENGFYVQYKGTD